MGADYQGNPVVDPTKNVLDLVQAAIKRQDDLRDAATHRHNDLRALNVCRLNELREAETRRLGELASLRVYYDGIIEAMRRESLKLLADQLRENKSDLSERTAKLEQFRWETGGRSQGFGMIAVIITQTILIVVAVATLIFRH